MAANEGLSVCSVFSVVKEGLGTSVSLLTSVVKWIGE